MRRGCSPLSSQAFRQALQNPKMLETWSRDGQGPLTNNRAGSQPRFCRLRCDFPLYGQFLNRQGTALLLANLVEPISAYKTHRLERPEEPWRVSGELQVGR